MFITSSFIFIYKVYKVNTMSTLSRGYNKITVRDFLDTIKRGTKGSKIDIIEVNDESVEDNCKPKLYNIITIKTNAAKNNNTVYVEIENIETEENIEEKSGENSEENNKNLNILKTAVDLNYKIYARLLLLPKDNVIQFISTTGTKYQLNKIEYTTNRYSRKEFPWLYYSIDENGNLDTTQTVKDNLKIYIKAI